MNKFVKAMQVEDSYKLTENGALALSTTQDSLVDLFATIGALRSRSESEIAKKFSDAFAEDNLLATRMSFYARNVRGGLGERQTARVLWRYLAERHPEIMRKNLMYVPYFGRWDDLYSLLGTPVEADVWNLIRTQFEEDMAALEKRQAGEYAEISLLAKWLRNANSKNKQYAYEGYCTAKALFGKGKDMLIRYRKARAALCSAIDVVEVKMSEGRFQDIKYPNVTSRAMMRYRSCFMNQDAEGFQKYLDSLQKGETKVNAGTLVPYDIMHEYGLSTSYHNMSFRKAYDKLLEEQWKALPNYVEGECNVVVMADTSGSMAGRPLETAVGLAVYFAERNKGVFANTFMTFASRPQFVTLKGETLYDRIQSIKSIVDNTNLEAAFNMILNTAVQNRIPQEDMPKTLVIISDMEFDYQTTNPHCTYHDAMKQKYRQAGYEMPNVVYWNVASRQDTYHTDAQHKGVQMFSGQSAATFKSVMQNIGRTPYEAMVNTLNQEPYTLIEV